MMFNLPLENKRSRLTVQHGVKDEGRGEGRKDWRGSELKA